MLDEKQINALTKEIHAQNVAVGWYESKRPLITLLALINSELYEALEGYRKNLKDDHLPQYDNFAVEMADVLIRLYDLMGYQNIEYQSNFSLSEQELEDLKEELIQTYDGEENLVPVFIMMMTLLVMEIETKKFEMSYTIFVDQVHYFMKNVFGYSNFEEIIQAKLEYNKQRADHKLENRKKENGKRF